MRDSADRPATAPARGRGRSAIVTLPDHIGVANVDPLRMHQVMCWEDRVPRWRIRTNGG